MASYLVPLTNDPTSFNITIDNKNYTVICRWVETDMGGWQLSFSDAQTNESIVAGLPLVTGTDILAGLGYLGFGGSLIAQTDGDQFAVPTYENLGINSNVLFITED